MGDRGSRWWRWRPDARPPAGDDSGGDGSAGEGGQRAPFLRRDWRYTELQFAGGVSQSRMRTFQPDHLLIDYTRTMMATVLMRPDATRLGMVGLGGGSQAKFCYRHLPGLRVEVVENNPHVISLRRRFRIPDDDTRLQVVLADGAEFLRERRGRYDILLVDGYDETGIPEALSSQRFYDDCRAALAPTGGVMASNLYATDHWQHLERMRRSFGPERVLLLEERRQSNRVAFAWTGDPLPAGAIDLAGRAAQLPHSVRRQLADVFERFAAAWQARR